SLSRRNLFAVAPRSAILPPSSPQFPSVPQILHYVQDDKVFYGSSPQFFILHSAIRNPQSAIL
ncbi:MAG: hypothetical protein ACPGWR_03565, partial [Ardenticatenaceae bacterium]